MSFIRLRTLDIKGNRWLGSTVKITAIFDTAADSVSITIEDPSSLDQVDEAAMTVVANTGSKVWEYTYQSAEADDEGRYEVYIRATKGSNISFEVGHFDLADADDD